MLSRNIRNLTALNQSKFLVSRFSSQATILKADELDPTSKELQEKFKENVKSLDILKLNIRDMKLSGSRKSRDLRDKGLIPGVVYGVDDDTNVFKRLITVNKKDLDDQLRLKKLTFENTLYHLVIKNENIEDHIVAVPRQTQICQMSDKILCVNFLIYRPGTVLRIPIDFVNEENSVDIRRGCFVQRINPYVECVIDGYNVPSAIQLDLSNAQKGGVFRLNHLNFPENVRPISTVPLDQIVAIVRANRRG